ncbi:MAG: bacillithiol biosynthesis cysteine-adding enzyme BshC [Saprospiraceae bacterium]
MTATTAHPFTVLRFPFADVPQLSTRDKAYAAQDTSMRPFYKYAVNIDSFAQVIADKQKDTTDRALLVRVLEEQYENYETTAAVKNNIAALADKKTFTVITAHQPSLFTGPLYYVLKIMSCINLAEQLRTQYPDYQFVPIFVTGGEDHDFEEVNHTNLYGKSISWENDETGSVGMMKTGSLAGALAQLKDILGDNSERAVELYDLMERAHTQHEKYSAATIQVVNELFKAYGLVVAGMNHPELKRAFIPIIKKEIFEQPSKALIEAEQQQLDEAGFGGQAYPREINFFYLRDQIRERIVEEDGKFKVLNTDYDFTREQLEKEIDAHPEFFSPNVVMRPLYQETIFPNLAYIGGGGELAYWMERQPQFAHFGLNFPMLVRRNSVMWMDKGNTKKLQKVGLEVADLFTETEALIKQYVKANTENEIKLGREQHELREVFKKIAAKAKEIDPTVAKSVKAEEQKAINSIKGLEAKLLRAEKQQHDIAINQIRNLKDKLFPKNGLQERHDNFMGLYLKYGEQFFATLKAELNPLEDGFVVIVDK